MSGDKAKNRKSIPPVRSFVSETDGVLRYSVVRDIHMGRSVDKILRVCPGSANRQPEPENLKV